MNEVYLIPGDEETGLLKLSFLDSHEAKLFEALTAPSTVEPKYLLPNPQPVRYGNWTNSAPTLASNSKTLRCNRGGSGQIAHTNNASRGSAENRKRCNISNRSSLRAGDSDADTDVDGGDVEPSKVTGLSAAMENYDYTRPLRNPFSTWMY